MEARLFAEGTIPECATPEWYADRDRAPHLEEGLHRARLLRTRDHVATIATALWDNDGAEPAVVDLGAGDGGLLSLLRDYSPGMPAWGYDLQPTNVAGAAERGVNVRLGDCVDGDIEWAPIAVATEMLEHLVDPHGFVQKVAEHSEYLVASSPWTETAESHYAFHLWAWDLDGYVDLLGQAGYVPIAHDKVDMFQVIAARRA